jgi:hypothetical protein
MRNRFWLFKHGNTYYVEDSLTGKQESLHTADKREAERLRSAKNAAAQNPMFSLALGRAYLSAHAPKLAHRQWLEVMDELASHGCGASQERCQRAMRSRPFALIRHKRLTETTADDFRAVLTVGTVSTNNFLRRLHNLAVGLGWLPWPILPPKLWPKITPKIGAGDHLGRTRSHCLDGRKPGTSPVLRASLGNRCVTNRCGDADG